VDAGVVLREGDTPTFTTGLAAALLAYVASTILSIAYATTVLGRTVGFVLFDPGSAARIAYHHGGALRWHLVVAACVIVGDLLLRTFVARLVVASAGASVGFGRALAAFVISDLLGVGVSGWVASLGMVWVAMPLEWLAIAVATLILCSGAPGRATSGPRRAPAYVRPPDAPRDWPF
jgi:hypothetical protein